MLLSFSILSSCLHSIFPSNGLMKNMSIFTNTSYTTNFAEEQKRNERVWPDIHAGVAGGARSDASKPIWRSSISNWWTVATAHPIHFER